MTIYLQGDLFKINNLVLTSRASVTIENIVMKNLYVFETLMAILRSLNKKLLPKKSNLKKHFTR